MPTPEEIVATPTEVVKPEGQVVVDTKPTPVSLKDEDLVELTVDGQKVHKSWKEVRDGGQRQEDYTRGKQEVALRLKEVKELYDGLTAKQKEVFDKESAIDAILGRTSGLNKPASNDDEVVPLGTIKQTVQEMLNAERAEFQKTMTSQLENANTQRVYERWEEKVVDTVEKLTKDHPILAKIPNLVGALKRAAKDDNPQTEQEMLSAIVKAGKRVAKDIDDDYAERRKADDVRRKQLKEKGPEPANGQTSFKAPDKSYVKNRKVNWDELEKDVVKAIEDMDNE